MVKIRMSTTEAPLQDAPQTAPENVGLNNDNRKNVFKFVNTIYCRLNHLYKRIMVKIT